MCVDFYFSAGLWLVCGFGFGGFGGFFWGVGHLIYVLMFSSQVSGIEDDRDKAGNQVIFSRPGLQMIIQSVLYFEM